MALKIAVNGFGRIGRCVVRLAAKREDIELVAINFSGTLEMLTYLLKYDSVHREFDLKVEILDEKHISIDGQKVRVFSTREIKDLGFADLGATIVMECTGAFLTQEKCQAYLDNGLSKVILSAPAKDKVTATFVVGVNEDKYEGQAIISNASCTTNGLAPLAKVLDDALGIEKGLMTTIHAYTHGQSLVDARTKDFRRSRAAAVNIVPTSTGAAKAISLVLPQLEGKMHGQAVRVPVPNVSMVDLNVLTKKETTKEELNDIFRSYAEGKMKGILGIDDEYRVSSDFNTSLFSTVLATDLTQVVGGNLIKVMSWYDNEFAYSARMLDLAKYVSEK